MKPHHLDDHLDEELDDKKSVVRVLRQRVATDLDFLEQFRLVYEEQLFPISDFVEVDRNRGQFPELEEPG